MARMSEEKRQRYMDDAYRAIGRYVAEFSELVREMRQPDRTARRGRR